MKLDPWLDRVKKKETCLKEINDEAAKIKVLEVQSESKVVDKLDEYLAEYQVHADDILQALANQQKPTVKLSSRAVFLSQRDSEARRALLDTRQAGVTRNPDFVRTLGP